MYIDRFPEKTVKTKFICRHLLQIDGIVFPLVFVVHLGIISDKQPATFGIFGEVRVASRQLIHVVTCLLPDTELFTNVLLLGYTEAP